MEKNLHNNQVMNDLKGFSIPWGRSKEEVWQDLDPSLERPKGKLVFLNKTRWIRAVAAVVILLISTGLFMRFFERNLESAYGEHLSHQLPDGSMIELNSGSELSYNPFWWRFDRSLKFEGEAFFMVQKGKRFRVESGLAATQVLGTSFSIFSRENNYRVVCHTGKVKVMATNSEESALLSPNQIANLKAEGHFDLSAKSVLPDPAPWKTQLFEYTGTPLHEVIDEIERQYDVSIAYPENLDHYYVGELNAGRDLQTTLNLVCKPFKITFVKISEGEYKIIENTGK